jgi:ribulose-phosphate 3-epimerase
MSTIIPAILPMSREDLGGKLAALQGLVDTVQIDIVDGVFASPATWPYVNRMPEFEQRVEEGEALPYLGQFHFEMDLMVKDSEQTTGLWIAAGAQRLTVHIESTDYMPRIITDLTEKYGHAKGFAPGLLSFGIALDIATPLDAIEPYMQNADYVQFMGIDIDGKQGQPFDPAVLQKIRAFRKRHPETTVQVDGGVSAETLPQLLSAGVDQFVVGSALWKTSHPAEALANLVRITQEHTYV